MADLGGGRLMGSVEPPFLPEIHPGGGGGVMPPYPPSLLRLQCSQILTLVH